MIYGWRSVKIKKSQDTVTCEKCSKEKSVSFDIYQEYMHMVWVPCFPVAKRAISQCAACGDIQDKQTFSENYKAAASIARKKAATPLWTFAGLLLIAIAVYFLYFTGKRNS